MGKVEKITTTDDKASSRRRFLRGGAAAVAMPAVSRAQETKVLKMQGAWGGGIFKEFAVDYVERVNQMSGGNLRIDYLDVNAVVKTAELQTAVSDEVLDAGHLVTAYWYSKNAAASLFGTGPCWGWTANQLLGWIKYGGGQALYEELITDILRLNLVGFFTGPMPAQPLGWFKEHITALGQLDGIKYRTVGLAANVLAEMGMEVTQLPGGEIQPAMQTGLIDAAEFNNPTSDKDFGMQDVSKHYHLASFHQSQETFEIVFNKDVFYSLSDTERAILQYASKSASADMSWKYQDRYSNDLIALQQEFGVNVYRTPDEIMAAQLTAWDTVLEEFVNTDPYFAKVVDSQKFWAKRVGAYEITNAPDYAGAYRHYFGEPV